MMMLFFGKKLITGGVGWGLSESYGYLVLNYWLKFISS